MRINSTVRSAACLILVSPLVALTLVIFSVSTAQAQEQTINCIGVSGSGPVVLQFDASANTCAFLSRAGNVGVGDILFTVSNPGANGFSVSFFADDNLDGIHPVDNNQACQVPNPDGIGSQLKGPNSLCTQNFFQPGESAQESFVITRTAPDVTSKMTVNYTLQANGVANMTANVVVGFVAQAANPASERAVQQAVSQSQATVVGQNIGARVATASASFGQRLRRTSGDIISRLGFDLSEDRPKGLQIRKTSLRDLAMMASFDTSTIRLGAAETSINTPTEPAETRASLPEENPVTIWGHGSVTLVDNDRNNPGDDRRFNGHVWGYNMGVDYRFDPLLIAGMSVGYSQTDLTTTFNGGSYEETNWSVTPYAIIQPLDELTISLIAGYSIGDIDRNRAGGVTGKTDSTQWFASAHTSYRYQPDPARPLSLTTRSSVLIANKSVNGFTESDGTVVAEVDTRTLQTKSGLEAAYSFDTPNANVEPFVSADYVHDFAESINDDRWAVEVGGGVRASSKETGLTASIEGKTQLGRSDFRSYSLSGLVAYNFDLKIGTDALGIAAPYVRTDFSPEKGPTLNAGIALTNPEAGLKARLDFNHSRPTNGPASTVARISVTLNF